MDMEYIIVQAGGLGTRLEKLTRNKPKALVSVNNLPIIFHLFQKYPNKKFIIIGDYKFDVLKEYLMQFATVQYMLVYTNKKGNAAGVKEALQYVPEGTPFMLMWSDLLLSQDFTVPALEKMCYIGISQSFPCSWSYEAGKLQKITSTENGVAGCFVFDEKSRLNTLPDEGSFATWLSQSGLTMERMDMYGSHEVGTLEAIKKLDSGENRCRPYNHMEFTQDTVVKTGLTKEGKDLIDREVRWYGAVSKYGFDEIPQIYREAPLTMERIYGENIFKANLDNQQKKEIIDKLVESLEKLHSYEKASPDYFGLQEDYYSKTIKRINGIRNVIPFTNQEYITINGKQCRNVFFFESELESNVRQYLFDAEFGPIHGDCTLTNTMIDTKGKIYYIDARGYFGKREIFGDVYYDWAKLYYSIEGCFDQFNIKNFDFEISETEVKYQIADSGWRDLTAYFLSKIQNCDIRKLKLIHAIVWLSLASHCWEDYDSMCLAFYNGLYLWNDWLEEYNN